MTKLTLNLEGRIRDPPDIILFFSTFFSRPPGRRHTRFLLPSLRRYSRATRCGRCALLLLLRCPSLLHWRLGLVVVPPSTTAARQRST